MDKRKKKNLYLALTIGWMIFLTGTWIATQNFAKAVHYDPLLGTPISIVADTPLFLPYKYLQWYIAFGDILPQVFAKTHIWVYGSALFALFIGIYIVKAPKKLDSQGTARWATKKDMREAKLLIDRGVILGLTEDGQYLRHDDPEHVLVMAPTRSGKGVGIIIPTLLAWEHSVIVTDIKGENWGKTSGFRKKLGHKVIKFEPTAADRSTACFNPFDEIRLKTPKEVADVQNISNILVDPQGKGDLDHWKLSAQSLMVGAILYLKYVEPQKASLGRLISFLTSPPEEEPDADIRRVLEIMRTTDHVDEGDTTLIEIYGVDGFNATRHPIICQTATEMLNKADEELASVVSTVTSILAVYRDPVLARNLGHSDFTIHDLMNHETPVALYLVVPPSDLDRMNPIFRLIVEMMVRRSIEKMEFKDGREVKAYKHKMLLLLDEFPALGRLDTMERALAYIAGYGLKALLIVQSLNQLNKTYTENNSIIDNCHIRIFFTPNDIKTPELIARMLGKRTEIVRNDSTNNKDFFAHSQSTTQVGRELMKPEEIGLLKKNEELIFIAGFPPMKVRKIFYYEDQNFVRREIQAPDKSDIIVHTIQEETGGFDDDD